MNLHQKLAMARVAFHRLHQRGRVVKLPCLIVGVLCGLLIACPFAFIFQNEIWEPPSVQTRKQVEAGLKECLLDASELPSGWHRLWPMPAAPYEKGLHGQALGSIMLGFFHHQSDVDMPANQEILFYRSAYRAASAYRRLQTGYTTRGKSTWPPLDLTQANLSANEYEARCSDFMVDRGPGRGLKVCATKARYGRFISVFTTDVSSIDMTVEEMIQVLQAIDRRMLQCVDPLSNKRWEEG